MTPMTRFCVSVVYRNDSTQCSVPLAFPRVHMRTAGITYILFVHGLTYVVHSVLFICCSLYVI